EARPAVKAPVNAAAAAPKEGWDLWTHRMTDAAVPVFLALQLPQIVKNWGALSTGLVAGMAVLPWLGFAAGILGNSLLLARFLANREPAAARVQAVGILASAAVLGQLFAAGFAPAWGLAAVIAMGGASITMGVLQRTGRLSPRAAKVWANAAGWTATALFMYGPAAQIMANLAHPAVVAGLSLLSVGLGTLGNLLMLPRAVYTRDWVWFTGSAWASLVGGLGVAGTMALAGALAPVLVWSFAAFLPAYLGLIFYQARRARK
ncbi:MAG: hypothetical protein KGL53_14195, partial [Elusimicrobia bacterium]|nr:hypothetical protein [Elusimicrobiota bacterium]